MKVLRQLLEGISCSWNGKGELTTPIAAVRSDSRKVKLGDLFVAIPGFNVDGYQFIADAIQRGAKAVVAERFDRIVGERGIPQFVVSDSRTALACLVASAYDFPARKLKLIGITGTNGKTTTSFLIQYLLNAKSHAGLIGSIWYDDGKTKMAADNTTPPAEVLQETLAKMVNHGMSYCVMEVSSHALDQSRTSDLLFSSAVFTNLTQDHLDYHHDFEAYYKAKRRLFLCEAPPRHSIINCDDSYGARLWKEFQNQDTAVSYGVRAPYHYLARQIKIKWDGLVFELLCRNKSWQVRTPLTLGHNVYNALAALSAVSEEGFPIEDLLLSLSQFPGVPGRMERIDEGQDFYVFVDYAHTPDGLFNVLSSVSELPKNRVISVFGCGGDRDRGKRSIMGEIANRFSDLVILTSDNPRSEDPEDILSEIKKGINPSSGKAKLLVVPDREEAIRQAIETAESGDVVFIFGKGHETYQILGKQKVPFSDQSVVRHWLKIRCSTSAKSQKLAVEN